MVNARPGSRALPLLLCLPATCIPGCASVVRTCCDCRCQVWVSTVMAPAADAGEMTPCCEDCTGRRMGVGVEMVALQHPSQLEAGMSPPQWTAMCDQILARVRDGRRG